VSYFTVKLTPPSCFQEWFKALKTKFYISFDTELRSVHSGRDLGVSMLGVLQRLEVCMVL
jgi:hypothetical protein